MVFDRFLSFLFDKTVPTVCIGVEFSASAVKLVEIRKIGDRFELINCVQEFLPWGAVHFSNLAEVTVVETALKTLLSKISVRSRFVATVIAESLVTVRDIKIPKSVTQNNIENVLLSEVSQAIGAIPDELSMDYRLIATFDSEEEDLYQIFVSRKELIEERVALFEECNLKTLIVDVDHYAWSAAMCRVAQLQGTTDQIIAAIDCGASRTQVSFFKNDHILFSKDFSFGGHVLTQEVQGRFHLAYREARLGQIKKTLPADFVTVLVPHFLDQFSRTVEVGFQGFYSSTSYSAVDKILLAGNTCHTPGLVDRLEEQFNMSVSIANPFMDMKIGTKVSKQALQDAPGFMTVVGILLRNQL